MDKKIIQVIMVLSVIFLAVCISPKQVMAADGSLKVQMFNLTTSSTTNTINPRFKVTNTGSTSINLLEVKLRYYYTKDNEKPQKFWCDYADGMVGDNYIAYTSNVTGNFVDMSTPSSNADTYLEIVFQYDPGTLNPGATVDIQTRIAKSDWTNYDQANDYSFNSSASIYEDWYKVAAYIGETKVWGGEPTGLTVTGVSAATANGSYKEGDTITIIVTFSRDVNVDTTGGTPVLHLETGTTDHDATYLSGNGTSTLTFNYTVQSGDTAANLDYIAADSLDLKGGTIKDAVTDVAADLILAAPGTTGSLGKAKAIVIDAAAYTLTYTAGPNGTISGQSVQNVARGTTGSAITAVPNSGYHFVNWSDNVATATRTDRNIQNSINVTANFAADTPPNVPTPPSPATTSSSSSSSSSSTQPKTETRQVPVVVEKGNQQSTAVQTTITRTTDAAGIKTDTVRFDETTAAEAVKKASETKSGKAAIDISNTSGNSADRIEFQLPAASMKQFANNNMSLSLQTEKAALEIPAGTVKNLKGQNAEIKISEEKDSGKIENNKALILKLASGSKVIAAPLNIEANFTGRTKITIPIDSSKLPGSKEELEKFISSLAVMIHHSDGEDVVDKGTIVYDEKGNVVGISICVDKFSSFTLIEIPKDYFHGKTTVMKDKVAADKEWNIKFTKEVDAATVTKENVYVVDSKGNKVDVKISCSSDNVLKIAPVNPYTSGEAYYLCITKGVKAKDKTLLLNELRYQFTVK